MRILIVSNSPWRSDNSFGNSFSNIFEGIDNIEIANICCKYGAPQNNVASKYFRITEKSLINNLLKGKPSGEEVFAEKTDSVSDMSGEATFNKVKKYKSIPMYWARALIWKIGRWKSGELIRFLDDFKPEILFIPVYYSHYIHDINKFIIDRYNIPCVGYVSDDVYTLRQFSLSPFYWIDRLILRPKMKKVFSWCKTVYVISETQRREYAEIFGDKFKILTKCADFSDENKPAFKAPSETLKLVYAGNVSRGRYKILARLCSSIKELNSDGKKFFLDIYTSTPLSDRQRSALNIDGSSQLHPPVSYNEILMIQKQADILVHAEAFDLREKLVTHQSFSTKIVDYLASGRCILAIGDSFCASVQYFIDNDCGAVAQTPDEIEQRLRELYDNKDLLSGYADKAWESGRRNHQRSVMQKELYAELEKALEK
ncbi:MAG: glycosyltransferase family 4 protein [Ruminococcaceae bacterium]|nr:glycosyltransferase family 4 protein [Oscillospiraceae bacterium]